MNPTPEFLAQCRGFVRLAERSHDELPPDVHAVVWVGHHAAKLVPQPAFRLIKDLRDTTLAQIAAGAEAMRAWAATKGEA